MKNTRLKQFGISFLVVLSLFVSSISACACSHHQEKIETEVPSCHQHSEMTMMEEPQDADSAENFEPVISETDCSCLQPAPKVVSKGENFKAEKQSAEVLPQLQVEFKPTLHIVSVKTINFEPPFYLSDSFYNISPSRGPPRL